MNPSTENFKMIKPEKLISLFRKAFRKAFTETLSKISFNKESFEIIEINCSLRNRTRMRKQMMQKKIKKEPQSVKKEKFNIYQKLNKHSKCNRKENDLNFKLPSTKNKLKTAEIMKTSFKCNRPESLNAWKFPRQSENSPEQSSGFEKALIIEIVTRINHKLVNKRASLETFTLSLKIEK